MSNREVMMTNLEHDLQTKNEELARQTDFLNEDMGKLRKTRELELSGSGR